MFGDNALKPLVRTCLKERGTVAKELFAELNAVEKAGVEFTNGKRPGGVDEVNAGLKGQGHTRLRGQPLMRGTDVLVGV